MDLKKAKLIIWALVAVCILSLVLAVNAGTKRKTAMIKVENLTDSIRNLEAKLLDDGDIKVRLEKELKIALDAKKRLEDLISRAKKESDSLKSEVEKLNSLLDQTQKDKN